MAEAHSSREQEPESASRTYSRVHKAVFDAAFEFVPNDAIAAVIDNEGEQPVLVGLSSDRLYLLGVDDLSEDLVGAKTTCRMVVVDPARSKVECETSYTGHRTGPARVDRESTWRFEVGDEKLTISTVTAPTRDWLEPGETFAQALADALGWEFPQPESARPPITILEEAS